MSNIKSFVLLAATAAASFGSGWCSRSRPTPQAVVAPKMVVHFKPEDLNTEEGIQKVYLQIRTAAETVCPGVDHGNLSGESADAMACRKSAIANAVDRDQ